MKNQQKFLQQFSFSIPLSPTARNFSLRAIKINFLVLSIVTNFYLKNDTVWQGLFAHCNLFPLTESLSNHRLPYLELVSQWAYIHFITKSQPFNTLYRWEEEVIKILQPCKLQKDMKNHKISWQYDWLHHCYHCTLDLAYFLSLS